MVRSGISLDSRVVLQMPQPPGNNFGESVAGTLMFIEHTGLARRCPAQRLRLGSWWDWD